MYGKGMVFFFSSRRRHTRCGRDWSSDVCSSDLITIQNDGAPIPTEHIGKIFEPGFTTKAAGTGLGLASVKKIIEEHRGQISIASGPDQGTAVIIRLPAYAAARPRGRGPRRHHRS